MNIPLFSPPLLMLLIGLFLNSLVFSEEINEGPGSTIIMTNTQGTIYDDSYNVPPENNPVIIQHRNGTKVITYEDGSSIQINPDGSKLIMNQDGSYIKKNADGSQIIKNARGKIIKKNAAGSIIK